ncbi:MAG TPA: SDR family oxidoreductase [Pirellulales bacterium]|nr:SDR family oxidoreductase [Pirellulales bacterium]
MRLLITGASGLLGGYLLRTLAGSDHAVVAWSGPTATQSTETNMVPVDLADRDTVAAAFAAARPDAVLHAAAVSSVARCFQQPAHARAVNVGGTQLLTELAVAAKARLLFVSTDLVFDGQRGGYREDDAPAPLSIYGQTKLAAEQMVLSSPRTAVARVSLLFGPGLGQRRGFFDEQLAALRAGRPCQLFIDEWRAPLALSTAAEALVALAVSDFEGLLHLGGPERMSRWEMGARLAAQLRCDASACLPVPRATMPAPEPRPRDNSLDSSRWRALMPSVRWPRFEEALSEMGVV